MEQFSDDGLCPGSDLGTLEDDSVTTNDRDSDGPDSQVDRCVPGRDGEARCIDNGLAQINQEHVYGPNTYITPIALL